VPVCEYARENNIPIFRPDEFIGGLARPLCGSKTFPEAIKDVQGD
jgi:hypothetical protein